MIKITAYLSADGAIHRYEKSALEKDEDLLGEELDGLLKMFELDISKSSEYKALLTIMGKKIELRSCLRNILSILEHSEKENDD
jgi:hypothetical protein